MASELIHVEDGSLVVWSEELLLFLRSKRILAQTTTARQMQRKHQREVQAPSTIGREAVALCERMGWLALPEDGAGGRGGASADGFAASLRSLGRSLPALLGFWPDRPAADGRDRAWEVAEGVVRPGDSARFVVFMDLWRRGYYVGDGCRYGADFVAYEKDPDLCHSFAAVVVRTKGWSLSMPQLAGLTRMQNVVRKAAVFAFVEAAGAGADADADAGTGADGEGPSTGLEGGDDFGVRISGFSVRYTSSSFMGVV